jgi:hypothetical protein
MDWMRVGGNLLNNNRLGREDARENAAVHDAAGRFCSEPCPDLAPNYVSSFEHPLVAAGKIMHVPSRVKVAVAVTLATSIVCFFGIHAELRQAKQSLSERALQAKPNWQATQTVATARDETARDE